jgi:hypothetical protein
MNNTIYFGEYLKEDKAWRGNLNLVWGDITIERDPDNGLEYLTLSISVKRHSSHNSSAQGKTAGGGAGGIKNNQVKTEPQQVQSEPATATSTSTTPGWASPVHRVVVHRVKTGTQTNKLRAAAHLTAAQTSASLTTSHSSSELSSPRVYSRQPANLCPVEAYKLFKSRRPNNCLDRESPFYLAPNSKSKFTSKVWYKALAMSCQRLDALFYCLFKKANMDMSVLPSVNEEEQQRMIAVAMDVSAATNDVVVWKSNKPTVVAHAKHGHVVNNNQQQMMFGMNTVVLSSGAAVLGGALGGASAGSKASVRKNARSMKSELKVKTQRGHNHLSQHHLGGQQQALAGGVQYASGGSLGGGQMLIQQVPVQVQVQVQVQVRPTQHQIKQQMIQQHQLTLSDTGSYQMLV